MKAKACPIVPDPMVVPVLLSSQSAPFWLLRLCTLQSRFSGVTFLLVTAMLAVYGWTVYSQNIGIKHTKARILQRHERQLTTTNEVLKNQMALQAEQPATGLVRQSRCVVIF